MSVNNCGVATRDVHVITGDVIGNLNVASSVIHNDLQKDPESEEDESFRDFFPETDDSDRPSPRERLDTLRKQLEDVFVETEFFRQLKTTLQEQGTVLLTGPPGDGKTAMAVMMCKYLEEKGYTAEYHEYHVNVDAIAETEKGMFLVIDNAFGRAKFDNRKSETTEKALLKVRGVQAQTKRVNEMDVEASCHDQNKQKTLVLILSRDDVYKRAMANVPGLRDIACRLGTESSLKPEEKTAMLSKYCRKAQKAISESMLNTAIRGTRSLGFPFLCHLIVNLASSDCDPVRFFQAHLVSNSVGQMMSKKPMKKFALALLLLEEPIRLRELEDSQSEKPKKLAESLSTVAKELSAQESIPGSELSQSLQKMCNGLLRLEGDFIWFSCEAARNAVFLALAEYHMPFVARHCSLDFISNYIRLAEGTSPKKNEESVIRFVPDRQRKYFAERLTAELQKGNLNQVFAISMVRHHSFLKLLMDCLVKSDRFEKDIAHSKDDRGLYFLFRVCMASFESTDIFELVEFSEDEIWQALCACCTTGHASQVRIFHGKLRTPTNWTKALCEHKEERVQIEDRMNFSLNTCPDLQMHKSIPGTLAAASGHAEVLETLLDLQMSADAQNMFCETPLMHACGAGHKKLVELLVVRGADVTISDRSGRNALHWAIWFDESEAAEILLENATEEEQQTMLDNPNTSTGTPLMLACWKSPEVARLLLALQVDTTLRDGQGRTCLHYACSGNDPNLIQEMINLHNVDVSAVDNKGFSPLHQACSRPGNKEIVGALLVAGANPNMRASSAGAESNSPKMDHQTKPTGVAPLHVANSNDLDIVKLLLEEGAQIDALDEENQTPIMYACNHEKSEIVEFLQSKGANLTVRDSGGNTILHHVAKVGSDSAVDFILKEKPEMLNAKNGNQLTPLCVACGFGKVAVVKNLISRGAKTEKSDENGGNVLHVSSAKGQLNVTKFLFEKTGIGINSKDKKDWTPLMLACFFGRHHIIYYLLVNGANIRCKDENGNTVMHLAAASGNSAALLYVAGQKRMEIDVKSIPEDDEPDDYDSEIDHILSLRQVLREGADPSALDRYGNSLLHHAAAGGNMNIIQYFLDEMHILVDEQNVDENTPFLMACISGQKDALKHFVTRGANPKVKDRFGNTAIHHAGSEGHLEVLEYLVETLCLEVNEVNSSEETPLALAIHRKRKNVYKYLRDHGAVACLSDFKGFTPLHTAASAGNIPAAEDLLDHGNVTVDIKNSEGETPLHCASWNGQAKMVTFLIDRGASIYAMHGRDNHLPVHLAAKRGDLATMKVLLEKDRRTIDAACGTGRTPLSHGCEEVDVKTSELAKYLIEFDKSSKHRENGDTSLHVAARGGHMTTVLVLVEKVHMKVGVRNHKGETPLDCARAAGHTSVITYLEQQASRPS